MTIGCPTTAVLAFAILPAVVVVQTPSGINVTSPANSDDTLIVTIAAVPVT